MKLSHKTGIAFGLTSGVITTLGVMIGLNAATSLKLAIIAGILTVAISDAFSDALGIHISQETSTRNNHKQIWEATFATFSTKLVVALTFLVPVLIFPLQTAIKINLAWGFLLIITLNYHLAKSRKESPTKVITGHLAITVLVITITYYIGKLISIYF
jgi:vacuolar iron transporter family protein